MIWLMAQLGAGEVIGAIAGIGLPFIGCVYYVATKLQRIEDKLDGLPCVRGEICRLDQSPEK